MGINIRNSIRRAVEEALRRAQQEGKLKTRELPPVVVEPPTDKGEDFGDYASPIALALAKKEKKKPLELLKIIAGYLEPPACVGKVEGAKPGFLNFRLAPAWLLSKLDEVVEEGVDFGRVNVGQGQEVNLEFISANPTGPLHVGNARAAFYGDILARVLDFAGYHVDREYYVNDRGTQVEDFARAVLARILKERGLRKTPGREEDAYSGPALEAVAAEVAEEMEEDGHTFRAADAKSEKVLAEVRRRAVEQQIRALRELFRELKIEFNHWTYESALIDSGAVEKVLQALSRRGLTYQREGALYFRSTRWGDEKDRVLRRRDRRTTYFANDLAYHLAKYRRGYDLLINIWGADHHGAVKRLQAGLQALGADVQKLRILIVQLVRLRKKGKSWRMSKRKGQYLTVEELVREMGLSAARFFMARHSLDAPLEIDVELAREQSERNPVYYVQYAYVRMQSVMRKAKERGIIVQAGFKVEEPARQLLTHTAEINLVKHLLRFPEVIEDAARSLSVHNLPRYALELARRFHVFYRYVPILSVPRTDLKHARLYLLLAARQVLGNLLELMGMEKPDVM